MHNLGHCYFANTQAFIKIQLDVSLTSFCDLSFGVSVCYVIGMFCHNTYNYGLKENLRKDEKFGIGFAGVQLGSKNGREMEREFKDLD